MLIEPIVLSYLQAKLDVPVFMEIPAHPTDTFVTIQKIDAGERDHIFAVTLEIHSYAQSKFEAAELDDKVREAMENIVELDAISASKFGGGNDAPNTSTKMYRYRSYYNLFY